MFGSVGAYYAITGDMPPIQTKLILASEAVCSSAAYKALCDAMATGVTRAMAAVSYYGVQVASTSG